MIVAHYQDSEELYLVHLFHTLPPTPLIASSAMISNRGADALTSGKQ